MRIPHIYFIMNKISDLSDYAALNSPKSIAELRKHVNMLVIDDNDFAPEKYLKQNGYQIQHKTDIETIKDVNCTPFLSISSIPYLSNKWGAVHYASAAFVILIYSEICHN